MDALEQARAEIDTVDAQLAALFERRMAAVLQVAEYKRAHGLPIYDAAREAAVLEKAAARIQQPALRYLDGHLPKSDADSDWWNMVYRWTDCPVLTGMELGSYTSDAVQSASGDSQQLLADYYIGIRGAWLKESASLLENSEPLWENLTVGAVSTAGEGH